MSGQQTYIHTFGLKYIILIAWKTQLRRSRPFSQAAHIGREPWFFATMISSSLRWLCIVISFLVSTGATAGSPALQSPTPVLPPWVADRGHNELYTPTPNHIVPMKKPLTFDAKRHYYEPHFNNERNGTYKRSSCPALNTLANRGFIPRTGRHVTYQNIAQSMRDIFNFGDDNVLTLSSCSISPAEGLHRSC